MQRHLGAGGGGRGGEQTHITTDKWKRTGMERMKRPQQQQQQQQAAGNGGGNSTKPEQKFHFHPKISSARCNSSFVHYHCNGLVLLLSSLWPSSLSCTLHTLTCPFLPILIPIFPTCPPRIRGHSITNNFHSVSQLVRFSDTHLCV